MDKTHFNVQFLVFGLLCRLPPIPAMKHSDSQIQKLQACLNRSLSSTLHVYGHATALLAEVGIPPLHITQNLQLAQFRYHLSTNQNNIIPHTLYVREQHARAIMHNDTMGRRMQQAVCQVDRDRIDPHTPMPISAASQTAEPRKIIREAVFQKMDAAPPV